MRFRRVVSVFQHFRLTNWMYCVVLKLTTCQRDVSGGWHDAGDYGRYVVTGAKTIADLLYAYQTAPQLFQDDTGIPESENGVPDILDEARYEIEWMLKMQDRSGGVHHKVTRAAFPGYVMPEKETDELIVTSISTTATADFCGTMALVYEFYQEIDADFAKQCLDAGEKAWDFLAENPNLTLSPESMVTTLTETNAIGQQHRCGEQLVKKNI